MLWNSKSRHHHCFLTLFLIAFLIKPRVYNNSSMKNVIKRVKSVKLLTQFRKSFFGAGRWWGGTKKGPPPWNLSHISYSDETRRSYTLPKENLKLIWIRWHTPWVLVTSAFFHRKSANFAISRNTDTDCRYLISNSFNFSWIFKDCFNKHGYKFDDVSKNCYP